MLARTSLLRHTRLVRTQPARGFRTLSMASANNHWTIVTGGNRGIGLEAARLLAEQGRNVLLTSRDLSAGEDAAKEVKRRGGGKSADVKALQLDVASGSSRQAFVKQVKADYGGSLLGLVHNAGVYAEKWDQESWDTARATNLVGPIELTQQLAPDLVEGEGSVVLVSSGYGQLVHSSPAYRQRITAAHSIPALLEIGFDPDDKAMKGTNVPTYKVTKALLNRAAQLLAADPAVKGRGITVNSADPGHCRTRMGGNSAARSDTQGAESVLAPLTLPGRPSGGTFYDGQPSSW